MLLSLLITAALILYGGTNAAGCNECHSKNPKMVRMHKELGYKDCFKCHGPMSGKPMEERKKQRPSEPLCMNCHKK